MNTNINIQPDRYYHIFNKARNGENLFREPDNYRYFLALYSKYIDSIADTYSWVLMPNHFHFLVKINREVASKKPFQYWSNLFNAYTKAFNKKYNRIGPLFVSPYKRIEISCLNQFKNVIHYIHRNPVHHGFCDHIIEYPWSSYQTIISVKETKLKRDNVVGCFDGIDGFISYHDDNVDYRSIEDLIKI